MGRQRKPYKTTHRAKFKNAATGERLYPSAYQFLAALLADRGLVLHVGK